MKKNKDGSYRVFNQDPKPGVTCNYKCTAWHEGGYCLKEKCSFRLKKKYKEGTANK